MSDAIDQPLDVLVYAPIGRDATLTTDLLTRASIPCRICMSMGEVCDGIEAGAGAVLLTEEALHDRNVDLLAAALEAQPAWSDISVLLFAGGERTQASVRTLQKLEVLRNVTLLDRPIRVFAVVSTVRAALRGRRRQYELRDVLVHLHSARTTAEEASRLKDEFLATLSHELRTPLNAILGWVSMLRDGRVDAARVPKVLEIIERNAAAQSQLIADVLDVSRMITGRVRLEFSDVDVGAVLGDAIDSVRPAADAKGLQLQYQRREQIPPVTGDAARLQQVFWNLLSNAVKFTPRGGCVDVRLGVDQDVVEIGISDTGIGLSPQFLPYAFDRFRQQDQSFTRRHGGLGLGLAIVKTVVEMHGGQVVAESDGEERGATFRVRLPMSGVAATPGEEDEVAPIATIPLAGRPDFAGRFILVVEDDATTRDLLVTLLTQCNACVNAVASAAEALKHLDVDVPAVLLADIGMPDEDGLSMMRRIRQRAPAEGGRVRSVAFSAYARRQDRDAAMAAGFDDFLPKPASPAEIVAIVERWLQSDGVTKA